MQIYDSLIILVFLQLFYAVVNPWIFLPFNPVTIFFSADKYLQ